VAAQVPCLICPHRFQLMRRSKNIMDDSSRQNIDRHLDLAIHS